MKFAKLSLAAAAVVGFSSSAMALDLSSVTVKPYVNTKLYYETIDQKNNPDGSANSKLFNRNSASGQAFAQIGITGKFNSCWGYGLEYSVADTLGLENDVVSNTRMGASPQDGSILDTQDWMSQAYVTFKGCGTPLANTTFKIGRQYLDTPLAFTETWNVAPNSFDAIVVANSDIKNVTLVAASVGKGNGVFGRVTNGQQFTSYVQRGAYAVGALTNFGIPVNVWYYNVREVAKAWWADASFNIMSAKVGLQYGTIDPNDSSFKDTKGGAVQLSGSYAGFDLAAAYSKMDDDGVVALGNTATNMKKTKLYTAGIYTDGTGVAVPGSKAYKLKAATNTPIGKLTVQYVDCENDTATTTSFRNALTNVKETDVILGTKVLGINTKLIYINRNVDSNYVGNGFLQNDTNHVRIILSKKF